MSIPCKMRPAGLDSLPLGYTRLEYLESTGTQHINTGLQANQLSLSITFRKYNYSGSDGLTIVGAQSALVGGVRYKITANYVRSVAWIFENEGVVEWSMTSSDTEGDLFTVVVDFTTMTVKIDNPDRPREWPINERFAQLADTIYMDLFAHGGKTPQAVGGRGILAKVYSFTAHYGGLAAANYVPALDHTGRPCMFDLVTRTPFYNAAGGTDFRAGLTMEQVRRLELPPTGGSLTLVVQNETFYDSLALEALSRASANGWDLTVLPQESDIPETYTRLDYLESSGKQWILVDDPFDANTGLLIKGACTEAQGTGQTWLFSVESNLDGINWRGVRLFYNNTYQGILMNVGINVPYTIREIERTYPLSYSFNYKCDRKFSIDGDVLIKTLPSEYPELASDKFALFASYDFLRRRIPWRPSVRILDFVVTQGNYVTRNFVPALDQAGVPCMFDIYSRQTYYNDPTATAPFIVGMTLEQVRELKLPNGGGAITLALPYEASIDGKAQAALEAARAQGWTLTLRYDDIKLPSGYTSIDYLEGSGKQYITTDLTTSNKTEIHAVIQIIATYTGTTQYYRLFGNATGADVPRLSYTLILGSNMSGASRFGTSSANVGWKSEYPIDGVYEYVRSNKECGVVGVYVAKGDWSTSWTCSAKLQIFAWQSVMSPVGRIYSFFVQEDGVLKGCFIPVLDDEGVPCMFDTISGKSYRSSGSLPFIAGMTVEQVRDLNLPAGGGELIITAPAEVFSDTLAQEALSRAEANGWTIKVADKDSKLPITYDRLEYLEGTGTQYINTGLGASNKTEIRCTHRTTVESDGTTRYMRLFQSQTDTDPNIRLTITQGTQSSGNKTATWTARFGSNSNLLNVDIPDFEIHELFLSSQKLECVDMGRSIAIQDAGEWTNPGGLLIARTFIGCIYDFTLKEAGVLKLNFIPALDPTGAPCMFDVVTQTAFYNDGAGADFLYPGSELQAATYSLRNRMYAKMTEHGLRRLYHVPAGCDLNKDVYAAQNGFKILVDTPKPEEGYWRPVWVEKEYSIELEWVETDPPEDGVQPY